MNSKRQKNGLVFWKIEVLKLMILMSQEEVYTNSVKCQELAKERAEIDAELETLYEKWEELAE